MSWIDIVFIVIVAICALIGIGKGTYKSVVSLFGNIFALVIAFFLTKTITLALLEINALNSLFFGKIYNWIHGFAGGLIEPGSFYYSIIEPIITSITGAGSGITAAQGVALYFSYLLACLIVFIILFILLRIVAAIIFKIIGSLINRESPGFLSRIIGFVVGAIKGALYVVIITLLFSFTAAFGFMKPVANEIEKSTVADKVYDTVVKVSNKIFNDKDGDTMSKLIELSGVTPEGEDPDDENTGDENTGNENTGEENTGEGE